MKDGPPGREAQQDSQIEPALLQAYRESDYQVFGTTPATLRIGVWCAQLAALHARYQTDCSAFITACNPHGQLLDDARNARHQQALGVAIRRLGLLAIPGSGAHPTGSWPAEPGYWVPGLTRTAAQQLGRTFQQNAVLWTDSDAVPQLLLLR